MKKEIENLRGRILGYLSTYFWILIPVVLLGFYFTDFVIFRYAFYIIGGTFLLLLFIPFLFEFLHPIAILLGSLREHFKQGEKMPFWKKFVFIPGKLVSLSSFYFAHTILSVWVLIVSFTVWSSVIGTFFTFLLLFLFSMVPILVFSTPFLGWYHFGLQAFLNTSIFFILAIFWHGFIKLAFPEDNSLYQYKSTPENFLGYSPQIFLLGSLSFQIIALPFLQFGFQKIASSISLYIGGLLILLGAISGIIWWKKRRKLSSEKREDLYKPSVLVYIFGLLITGSLYQLFSNYYNISAFSLYWLNAYFFFALIFRFFKLFKKKFFQDTTLLEQYEKWPEWVRWVLFFPISCILTLVVGIFVGSMTELGEGAYEMVIEILHPAIAQVFFLNLIFYTVPQGKFKWLKGLIGLRALFLLLFIFQPLLNSFGGNLPYNTMYFIEFAGEILTLGASIWYFKRQRENENSA